ncbi:MAG: hypothetical protein GY906_35145 [bacterium]|nr:hypothetical protein [bacterium]
MMRDLRLGITREEFDYPALMNALSEYSNPRAKVTTLLRRGDIVRVKKGLYVFGDRLRRRPYSREVLANLIYGPSFVSLEFALSYHGLLPERVDTVTSLTTKRPKAFETPVGRFVYRQSSAASFHLGMIRIVHEDIAFLIATPERALADTVRDNRGHPLRTQADAAHHLFDDLRIDQRSFEEMNPDLLEKLAIALHSGKIARCAGLLRSLRRRR